LLLAYFWCHHCLEVIHSEQSIGYVLKYCSKNSDAGRLSLRNVLYEGHSVSKSGKLYYYPATRISSASEYLAGICGYWRHHLKPSVQILNIHLPGKKIVLATGRTEAVQRADISSPVEKYFGRPMESPFDQLTSLEYHSRYSVDALPKSVVVHRAICNPVRFANQRKNRFCALLMRFIRKIVDYSL
jgi:hypothetical protein